MNVSIVRNQKVVLGIALFEESFSMIASPGATKGKLTNTINRWRIIKMRKFEFISMDQLHKDM